MRSRAASESQIRIVSSDLPMRPQLFYRCSQIFMPTLCLAMEKRRPLESGDIRSIGFFGKEA